MIRRVGRFGRGGRPQLVQTVTKPLFSKHIFFFILTLFLSKRLRNGVRGATVSRFVYDKLVLNPLPVYHNILLPRPGKTRIHYNIIIIHTARHEHICILHDILVYLAGSPAIALLHKRRVFRCVFSFFSSYQCRQKINRLTKLCGTMVYYAPLSSFEHNI